VLIKGKVCVFELDPIVLPTDIFLLAGQQDQVHKTSWCLDPPDNNEWEGVPRGDFELDLAAMPTELFLFAG